MKLARRFAWISALLVGVLVLCPCAATSDDGAEQEQQQEQEREMTMDQLPEAVRATILREAGEHTILEVEEVRIGERLFYEAEWIQDEMEVEVQVAPDGTLIGRFVEEPDEEGEEDDQEGDDEEEGDDD